MRALKQFTPKSLEITRHTWQGTAEALDIPFLDYEILLDWADKHIVYSGANGDSAAYGIFEDKSEHAVAVVDIVLTQRTGGDWMKMLSVKLGPMYAPAVLDMDPQKMNDVIDIYADATTGTFTLADARNTKVLKIYGRNDSLLNLLLALNERMKATMGDKVKSQMQGRWLVLQPNN